MLKRVLAGRYQVEEWRAADDRATVWRGRDLQANRPVAITVLTRPDLQRPEHFERDARTLARLAHPHIISVYDAGTDGGDPYLVTELLEGTTLAAIIAEGLLPVERVTRVATQVCDGLAAVHAAGLVHGDIRPENLILTPAGVVKISGFGIIGLRERVGQLSPAGAPSGASRYLAPERAAGGGLDVRTDLYALGCTLHAMLTGEPPFTGQGSMSLDLQPHAGPSTPLRSHRADIPPDLDGLVSQLLAVDPADRPRHAREVQTRLAAIAASSSPAAHLPPQSPWNPRLVDAVPGEPAGVPDREASDPAQLDRRKRGLAWIAAAFAIAVVLATSLSMLRSLGGSADPSALHGAPAASTSGSVPSGRPASTPGGLTQPPSSRPYPVNPGAPPGASAGAPNAPAPDATAAPATTAGPAATASPAATAGPDATAEPVPTASPPPDVQAAIADMRAAIDVQVDAGQLDPYAGYDLQGKVDQIAREVSEGDWAAARYYADRLRDKLAKYRDDGTLSSTGYQSLIAALDVLDDTLA